MPSRGQHFQAEEVSLVCSGSCWVTKGGRHPRGIHSRVQAALCLSFWGPLSGKWGCGQNSVCPMGCQEDSSSHVDRMRASDGSATSRLRVPVRSEGPGPWPWTAQIPLGQGVGPRVGQLWPWLRKSTVASIPTTWGMQPCQGPSLPTAAASTQPGTEEARAAATTVFSGQGCTGSGHSRVSSAHTCLRHTSACLILGGCGGHTLMRGTSRALWGHLSCLHMNVLVYWGLCFCQACLSLAAVASILCSLRMTP